MGTSCDAPYGILLASLARTADCYSDDMLNNGKFKGVLLHIKVTVNAGVAASVTPTIQYYDEASAGWKTWLALTAIAAVAETNSMFYPSTWNAAITLTNEKEAPMPYLWRLFMDHADANPITYSVGYQFIP